MFLYLGATGEFKGKAVPQALVDEVCTSSAHRATSGLRGKCDSLPLDTGVVRLSTCLRGHLSKPNFTGPPSFDCTNLLS